MAVDTIIMNGLTEEEDKSKNKNEEKKEEEEKKNVDPDLFVCLLQPVSADADPQYVGIRRLLLSRKAESGVYRRMDWRCNEKGYVAYRNYIRRPRNWENLHIPSHQSTPGNSGRWLPSSSPLSHLYEVESWSSSRDLPSSNLASGHRTSFSSSVSDSDHPRRQGVEPAYSFVGMHCIFDQCKAAVTVLKFGNMSSDLLAYGASDGTLTLCTVSEPASVIKQLKGHSKDVTDFDFSSNNQYIASSSLDKTVRIWELSKGLCIRVIYAVSSQLCIRFHPVNNNFLSVGNANKEITVFNFSTGRIINKSVFDNEITSMDHDHTGQLIFCGDAQGCIYSATMDSHTGALSRSHRHRSSSKRKSPVTTVQYRSFSLLAHGPVLLTCTQDGSLSYFRFGPVNMPCAFRFNSDTLIDCCVLVFQCCVGNKRLSNSSLLTQVISTVTHYPGFFLPFAFPGKRRIYRFGHQSLCCTAYLYMTLWSVGCDFFPSNVKLHKISKMRQIL
ncbi:transducin family protein [Tripterygium wilfordii]|uniref:Transducin family protein n=1 Tax=Tripterygium wilfordii TaxID=458696 RepID=A0A7J7DHB4_TRIWF|nr:transducin family protein [Tripterygium wilfordii]